MSKVDWARTYKQLCVAQSDTDLQCFSWLGKSFKETSLVFGCKSSAPRSDPEKSFGPSTSGVILGVWYDTAAWLWAIPEEKFIRLLHNLHFLLDNDAAPLEFMQRVLGKLIHVAPLVPAGKFNLLHVLNPWFLCPGT